MKKNIIVDVEKIEECGYKSAMMALSMNKKQTLEKMPKLAEKLAGKGNGHDKFLRFINVNFKIKAPVYFFSQLNTYKVGTNLSSTSIMHTLEKELNNDECIEFECAVCDSIVNDMKLYAKEGDLVKLRQIVPNSFIYTAIWNANYDVLRNVIQQRKTHRLPHWKKFIEEVLKQVEHPEFLK